MGVMQGQEETLLLFMILHVFLAQDRKSAPLAPSCIFDLHEKYEYVMVSVRPASRPAACLYMAKT